MHLWTQRGAWTLKAHLQKLSIFLKMEAIYYFNVVITGFVHVAYELRTSSLPFHIQHTVPMFFGVYVNVPSSSSPFDFYIPLFLRQSFIRNIINTPSPWLLYSVGHYTDFEQKSCEVKVCLMFNTTDLNICIFTQLQWKQLKTGSVVRIILYLLGYKWLWSRDQLVIGRYSTFLR